MFRRVSGATLPIGALLLFGLFTSPLLAASAGVRGRVIDEAGQPIADVKLDFEFLGESRVKVTKSQLTDKRGGFVRMGIPDGKWKITFTKEGYKTYVMEISLSLMSLGAFSEAGDIVLHPGASAAAAASSEPVAAVLPATPEASKAGEEYAKALEAARSGRFDEAEPALKEVLVKFPDLANAHYNLAYVYQMKKNWKGAEAEYLRVTELEPAKADAFIALAAVREIDGRGPEAAEGILAASPSFEQDFLFQSALGSTCANVGKMAEAAAAFQKAAALDPSRPEPFYELGIIAVGQNKVPDAIGLLEKYVGMTGQNPRNLENAKGILAQLKKMK
ncbi:MAG TPA: tetratricopeptide repeat protein [Vicinamibacteria bacterium]|nr:tetratricopeptide repeat protein [Vicinamibacteria bacterium]